MVGATQPYSSPEALEVLRKLEMIPLRFVNGQHAMDVETILHRHPQVCLVDGLAYDNPPGSRNAKRWQDVEELLQNGISVVTSVNLQYIEDRREQVEKIRGKLATQTIPESFLHMADEIELVDAPAESCLLRITGSGRRADGGDGAKKTLRIARYRPAAGGGRGGATPRRVLKAARNQPDLGNARTISGMGDAVGGCFRHDCQRKTERRAFSRRIVRGASGRAGSFAIRAGHAAEKSGVREKAGAKVAALDGADEVATLLQFAREHSITQIFVGHGARGESVATNYSAARLTALSANRTALTSGSFLFENAMPESIPRGLLKIYLGYAAGVGKTYRMLEDAHELSRKGVDVVVGYFEPHGRKDTIAIAVKAWK